ncbi:MAG: DUF11 domain-containing protein [Rhizobiales bacterium]|nr:DUF11 domain-containing protein [Hyphomicrobiales bacterium]
MVGRSRPATGSVRVRVPVHNPPEMAPTMKRTLRTLALALATLSATASASAARPALPGDLIIGQAEATYFNERLGIRERIVSNSVTAIVNAVAALEVGRAQSMTASPDEIAEAVFTVTNRGNVALSPLISFPQSGSDDFDLANVSIFLDTNGNGAIDPGEPEVTAGARFPLAVGERLSFNVRFRTPAALANGAASLSNLVARDPDHAIDASAPLAVTIAPAGLTLAKRASAGRTESGGLLTYTIAIRNNGVTDVAPYADLEGESLLVDGAAVTGVLVRDDIPRNTAFVRIDDSVDFKPLYHLFGAPRFSFVSAAPANAASVDAVAFLYERAYPVAQSTDLSFTVSVNPTAAATTIANLAETWQPDDTGGHVRLSSNEVLTPVSGPAGRLRFVDGTYLEDVVALPGEGNAHLQLEDGRCNLDAAVADQVTIVVRSTPDGDSETVIAFETAPNSGVFRAAPLPVQPQQPAVPGNATLTATKATRVLASAVCGGETLDDELIVNPGGFVFNSLTNTPIPGARVILRNGSGGVISQQTTDIDGFYRLRELRQARYVIEVTDIDRLTFASQRTVFTGFARNVHAEASYGRSFTMAAPTAQFGVDIPVDPATDRVLVVEKLANRQKVRIGEFVRYEVALTNRSDLALLRNRLVDTLPSGFAYVSGSARLDGAALADPLGAPGRELTFEVGDIARLGRVTVSYIAQVLPSAGQGPRTNVAVAEGIMAGLAQPVRSVPALATVDVDEQGGVFAREGVILGKVFLDCDADARQSGPDEIGLAGVRLVLSDGRTVVTDIDGKYSLPAVRAITSALAVDRATLPSGGFVKQARVRDLGAPGTRLVDLRRGEIRQEDFPIGPCSPAMIDEIARRNAEFRPLELDEQHLRADLPLDSSVTRPNGASREQSRATDSQIRGGPAACGEWRAIELPAVRLPQRVIPATRDLEQEISSFSPSLGFLDLVDGDELAQGVVNVRVKGPAEVGLALEVDGVRIPSGRIGQRVVDSANGVQAVEYIAVRLSGGGTTLRLVVTDPFGNERGAHAITVYAPGAPARIELIAPAMAKADPLTPIPLVVRILDAHGRPTAAPVELTLEARRGRFDARDIRDSEPGHQIYVDHGEAIVDFIPPALAGTHEIVARSGLGVARARIRLEPHIEQRMLVGVVEGAIRLDGSRVGLDHLVERDGLGAFEKTVEGARGELFLKGRIAGEALLTLRYQSDRDTEDRLFRDVRPDQYYPVYGDNSERGFEAEADGPLFVKVEKGQSYILYGDLEIAPSSNAIGLGAYRRAATGAHAHVEEGPVTIDLFVARTASDQVIQEIPGRGISGPYAVDLTDYVENSERVEIVTRDRDQPEVIIKAVTLRRGNDYSIDYFTGTLLFDTPIASFDDRLDPLFIRVTYETRRGGKRYWLYGGEARIEVADGLVAGYREVHARADALTGDRRSVRSAFAAADLGVYGRAEVEFSRTENAVGAQGSGWRASYEVTSGGTRLRLDAARTDRGFDVPGSRVSPGRAELRAVAEQQLGEGVRATAQVLHSRDTTGGARRDGVEGLVHWKASSEIELRAGARVVRTSDPARPAGEEKVGSAIVGATWRPAEVPGLVVGIEGERRIDGGNQHRARLEGAYQWSPDLRVYFTGELSTSDGGLFGLSENARERFASKLGVEYAWSPQISQFVEYRAEGMEIGVGAVANGVRGQWEITEVDRLRANVEHVAPVSDDARNEENTAVALGYTHHDVIAGILLDQDLEWRHGRQEDAWYLATGLGWRFGDFTLLLQNRLAVTEGYADRIRDRMRLGAAWRPGEASAWSALAWYGFEYDDDASEERREQSHSWSIGGEYQMSDDLRLRLRHAGRHHAASHDDIDATSLTLLLTAGLEIDLDERLSLALDGVVLHDPWVGTTHTGLGAEIGFAVTENMLLSVGYTFADIEEERIRDIQDKGFHVRVRAKLDSETWNIFDGGE